MKTALLRFAPVFTPRVVDDSKLVRECMVERGAIVPLSYSEPTPVVVNHDEDRQIGTVREFAIYDDVISGKLCAPYYFAHVNITGPTAMRRGDGVSWGYHPLRTMELAGTRLIRSALIREVSVLTPAVKPAEVFARVVWVGELEEAKASAVAADRAAADEYCPEWWGELERKVGYRITDENFERAITEANRSPIQVAHDELVVKRKTAPQVLIRPSIGQVLGVR